MGSQPRMPSTGILSAISPQPNPLRRFWGFLRTDSPEKLRKANSVNSTKSSTSSPSHRYCKGATSEHSASSYSYTLPASPRPNSDTIFFSKFIFILIVIHIFAVQAQLSSTSSDNLLHCPEDWRREGIYCYRFFNIRHSWRRAAEICRRYGSELVLISDFTQNNFTAALAEAGLREVGDDIRSFWIGFQSIDQLSTNTIESASGRFVSKYVGFWAYDEPNVENGQCVRAKVIGEHGSDGRTPQSVWSLAECEDLLPFVCQKQTCPVGSYHCSNGKCINNAWKCDGEDDCEDRSDEMDCPRKCSYYLQSSGDKVVSPNYPNKYEPNSDCKWTLEGPIGSGMVLQFSEFDTENNFDQVQILVGGRTEESSVSLSTLSGHQNISVRTFTTGSNLMIIKFRSDASVEKRGFRASWKTEPLKCGGEFFTHPKMDTQTLSSPQYPNYYPGGLECVYVITAMQGKTITLEIVELDIDPEKDFFLIRDGSSSKYPPLAKFSGNMTEALSKSHERYIVSTGSSLYIYFHSNFGVHSRKGFLVRYKAGCEMELVADKGVVTSPAFGVANYPTNQNCLYRITRESGSGSLSIVFKEFDVTVEDILQIYDGTDSTTGVPLHPSRGFGTKTKPVGLTLTASSGKMLILFKTNALKASRGWTADFSADCPPLKIGRNAIASARGSMFGAKVTFTCPIGQEFSTGSTRLETECLMGGKWSQNTIPNCQERYCGPVPQIDNGFAVGATNVTYRGVATYQCYAGFAFPSNYRTEAIRCGEDGKWEKLPLCLASSCPPLTETPHAIQTIMAGSVNRSYGTIVRFECEPGYHRRGVPVIVCTSIGQWSGLPPLCERAKCPIFPEILNGYFSNADLEREFRFGDELRVFCNRGYKLEGQSIIKCSSNQSFVNVPSCVDVDECSPGNSACDLASTKCVNTDGGFFCKCKEGFEPNLNCRPVSDLGLSTGTIPDTSIKVSSTEIGYKKLDLRLDTSQRTVGNSGWCGAVPQNGENWAQVDLKAPVVIRGFRIQSVQRTDGSQAYPLTVRLQYADDMTDLFRNYSDISGRPVQFRLSFNGASGMSIVNLPIPVEARYIRITLMEFVSAPCMSLELMGCTRQDCIDVNECLDRNGGCDQRCVNSPGGVSCHCNVGHELYTTNGTAGFFIPPSETGLRDGDQYRINKTCVPKQCPNLRSPEHGNMLSTQMNFHYGDTVTFNCNFGYVMHGSRTLSCGPNGVWNGTTPECHYAQCIAMSDDNAQGLKFEYDSIEGNLVPYLSKVNVSCQELGRPHIGTALANQRQCVYDPHENKPDFWLSGSPPSCPKVNCGKPEETTGANYGYYMDTHFRSSFYFGCEDTFTLAGKTSRSDSVVRCSSKGYWDFGDLRCEGPVCEDPGHPPDGQQIATSFEHGAQVRFNCDRAGYVPLTTDPINCVKEADCKVIKPITIHSDKAINASSYRINYEPKMMRLNSVTGWCAEQKKKEPFPYLQVDLGKVYRIKALLVKGVVTGDTVGRPTELRFFYKARETENFVVYFPNFNLTYREPGNYGELTYLNLPSMVVARYITLGIVSYQTNACMKFELLGCEDKKEDILLGFNGGYPKCVDHEPPKFQNCPTAPIMVTKSSSGILPVNYTVPIATDNSGYIARFEVNPIGFRPPMMVFNDTSVLYTAYDLDGNVATCRVNITVPESTPPALHCPQSYVIELVEESETYNINFNETRKLINATDESGPVHITLIPEVASIPIKSYRNVTVVATDRFGNEAVCHFQVSVMPMACVPWSLVKPNNGEVNCRKNELSNGYRCVAKCNDGYRFVDSDSMKVYECSVGNHWQPSNSIPDCVPEPSSPTDDSDYDVVATVEYRSGGFAPASCISAYKNYVSAFYEKLNQMLSQRCSAIEVQIGIHFFNTTISLRPTTNELSIEYVLRIDTTERKKILYELCGTTLGLVFDLTVPSSSMIIEPLLNISTQQVGGSCPSLMALRSSVKRGFTCRAGEIINPLNVTEDVTGTRIPRCLQCAPGTHSFTDMKTCLPCALGWYQDQSRQPSCRQCPPGTYTKSEGSKSILDCMPVCGYGTYSHTGMVPCLQCPQNTYTGTPPKEGFKECQRCVANTYTYGPGATSIKECKTKCNKGTYSETGLEPCSHCPTNMYQEHDGQTTCHECSFHERTLRPGALSREACLKTECNIQCQNGGACLVIRHEPYCHCPAGFTGRFCEIDIDECTSQPCYNGGSCTDHPQGYTCHCPPGFSGLQCEIEREECMADTCPEKSMCQNLPGIGNVNCLCRSGYEGHNCNVTVNPCSFEQNPCENDASCVPLLQGRYYCQCPPGWTGRHCETNIDDCAEEPCLLGASCVDFVNDFKCDCPPGFTGKRCEEKVDLCASSPCMHGLCVDRLFYHECICEPGWTGQSCEINIDDCASSPCENGAECIDLVNGYRCACDPNSYTGSRCQHEIDACEMNPCQNGGTCIDQIIDFKCQCKPGFLGLQCEAEVDECASNPCSPLGTERCVDMDNAYKCQCHEGFSGDLCETNIDDCSSSPCLNGGTCTDQINGFRCLCPLGWSGFRCEKDVGMCDSSPCHNNAKCVDLFQDYFCVCPSGTDGKRCQTAPQRCIGDPCQNDGICQDYGSGLNCSCPMKYSGIGCQYEYLACSINNRCQNGATCLDKQDGSYECVCPEGFTGQHCEEDIIDCLPTSCPPSATCIDLTNGFFCKCPFNMTGEDCRKPINIDYDLFFNDRSRSSNAALNTPFSLEEASSFTISLWVQFQPESIGTYFTLYEVDSPYVVSKIQRPLVQANHLGVLISLFNEKSSKQSPDVFMPYLENVPINDGQWHYINIIWNGVEGTLMLVTDTAVASTIQDYGLGGRLPAFGWVVLGAPVENSVPRLGEGFHGRLSRVNMWNRALDMSVEIPSQIRSCKNAPVIYGGLLLRWVGYDQMLGTVERIGSGNCGEHICANGYSGEDCRILQQDKTPPAVLHCPPDMWVISANTSTIVHWDYPQFADDLRNVNVHEVEKIKSGESLKKGIYDLSYIAMDENGNPARCDFQVHVLREFCKIPEAPINGQRDCSDWGPGGRFKVCQIKCNPGLHFSEPVPKFYVCGAEGFWRPTSAEQSPESPLVFPACSPKYSAQRIFRLGMNFPTSVVCSDSGKKILSARAQDSILRIDRSWKICSDPTRGSCKGLTIAVKCMKTTPLSGNRIAKRQARALNSEGNEEENQQDVYSLEVSFPANNDPITSSSSSTSMNNQDKDTLEAIIRRAVVESAILDVRDTLPNVVPDLTSLELVTEYACPPGQVVIGNSCVECGLGTYFDDASGKCAKCPLGFYQDELGQLQCKKCPDIGQRQGVTITNGARHPSECRERCSPGKYYDMQSLTCKNCGYGLYQPSEGSFTCIPCGPGLTTRSAEAVSQKECRPECMAGFQLSSTGNCEACPLGYYRTRGQPSCEACPSGFTTGSIAAINIGQCNLEICTTGHFLNISSNECQVCPKGTYQDVEQRDTSCQSCPPNSTTSSTGSTSVEQCSNPCLINDKIELCPANSLCEAPSVGSEDFRCVCKEGFKEVSLGEGVATSRNAPHCIDICEGYCINGGKCDWQSGMKKPRCECLINFYGDRCERKSELIYIAGGIGAAVFFIIFIVLLIWMICVRTATRPISKKMSMHTIPAEFAPTAGSQQNFYYGAPAPYAESIAPSHHSTYAHYYDDEDDGWEMPNFYNETYMKESLHNNKSNNGTLQGITNPSIYSTNKEDLYDRLRKHQYMGKKGDSTSESEDPIN